jgi:hypothetical protein
MEIVKMSGRLTQEEKETQLNYDNVEKTWRMYSMVQKHYNKALKGGWEPVKQYVYDDGTVAGYELVAPGRCITIRSVEKKKMSEQQMGNLAGGEDEDEE